MNYLNIYQELCKNGQKERQLEYSEIHHITPRCIGGLDIKENLTVLSAKEHYLAHLLLTKIYPTNYKIQYAFVMMSVVTENHKRFVKSKHYECAKLIRAKIMSEHNPMKNQNTVKKMSDTRKRMFSVGALSNPMHSDSAKKKTSIRMKANNPNKGGASNHTAYPVEIVFNDGSTRRFEYMKQVSENLNVPYSSLKVANRKGLGLKKHKIKQIRKI